MQYLLLIYGDENGWETMSEEESAQIFQAYGLGRDSEAAESYGRALELATQPAERAFLERRLAEVRSAP